MRTVRRALVRFSNKKGLPTLNEYRRVIAELNAIVDDVNTEPGRAAPASATVEELLRLGVLYRACLTCGKKLSDCGCPPERAGTVLKVNMSTLSDLAAVPAI